MKKKIELIGKILAVAFLCWCVFSWLEIGLRSPLAESHEYSPLNLIGLVYKCFEGVR